jgi:hypothetical protein
LSLANNEGQIPTKHPWEGEVDAERGTGVREGDSVGIEGARDMVCVRSSKVFFGGLGGREAIARAARVL